MSAGKIRVLQVVGNLSRGGIETWMMQVLRKFATHPCIQIDFLVHDNALGHYDEEAQALGAKIHYFEGGRRHEIWRYSSRLRRLLEQEGPYDVIHSHILFWSGVILRSAAGAGIPVRIANSHKTAANLGPTKRMYYSALRSLIHRHATHGLACSDPAGANLFGDRWGSDPRYRVLYVGVTPELFEQKEVVNREAIRTELGLPADAFVVGHIGRFRWEKNHKFLLDIGQELLRARDDAYLVMAGDGPLESEIRQQAQSCFGSDRIRFLGSRKDIPRLLDGLFDVQVLPSILEGLPVVGLEAQAAGVPIVVADTVAREMEYIPELVTWQSLDSSASRWSETILRAAESRAAITRHEAFQRFLKSPFNLDSSIRELEALYLSGDFQRELAA